MKLWSRILPVVVYLWFVCKKLCPRLVRTIGMPSVLVVFTLLIAMFTFAPIPAQALCSMPPEEGTWINSNPNTRSIPKIQLRFICQDQIHNGEPYPPGPPWFLHIYGACTPSYCDWGEVGANRRRQDNYIYGYYDQGYARRYVYVRMSQSYPGQLYLYIWNDFVDSNRSDYAIKEWFVKQ